MVWKLGLREKMRAGGGGEEKRGAERRGGTECTQSVLFPPTSLSLSFPLLTSIPTWETVLHCTGWTPGPFFPPPGPVFLFLSFLQIYHPVGSLCLFQIPFFQTRTHLSLSLLLIFPRRPTLRQHGEQITAKLLNMGSCLCKGHQGQSLPDCIWVCLSLSVLATCWSIRYSLLSVYPPVCLSTAFT